jgi:hypothetical protein
MSYMTPEPHDDAFTAMVAVVLIILTIYALWS